MRSNSVVISSSAISSNRNFFNFRSRACCRHRPTINPFVDIILFNSIYVGSQLKLSYFYGLKASPLGRFRFAHPASIPPLVDSKLIVVGDAILNRGSRGVSPRRSHQEFEERMLGLDLAVASVLMRPRVRRTDFSVSTLFPATKLGQTG